jgi:GT2 family glycosyltransferase
LYSEQIKNGTAKKNEEYYNLKDLRSPDISIIVVTYNREEMLDNALQSLIVQEIDDGILCEILVVDNASTDNTKRIVEVASKRSSIPIRYIFENRKGVAQARNRGIKESYGNWIAFFDDDQVAEPDWIKELYKYAIKTEAECVGGARRIKVTDGESFKLPIYCRLLLGETVGREKEERCGRKIFISSGNILIRKKLFDIIGNFDESMEFKGSDLDFFRKVRLAGFEAWYTPKAVVHHVTPSYRLKRDYLERTSLRYGAIFSIRDYREWGLLRTLLVCIGRIGQAIGINMSYFLWALLLRNENEKIKSICILRRTEGYIRQTLKYIAPRLFHQKEFFEKLNFRKERIIYKSKMSDT